MRSLDQCQIRAHLYAIEDYFGAVSRDIEVAHHEVRRKLGEYALSSRSKIEEREILMADVATKNHEGLRAMGNGNGYCAF